MHQFQTSVPLAGLPLQLILMSDASIALVRTQEFETVIDGDTVFGKEGFSIKGEEYQYNSKYWYKQMPSLLEYLQGLELIMPTFT